MRVLVLVLTSALCQSSALAQPTLCTEDAQCGANFYCETDIHLCQKCLHCEDLKRETPSLPTSCIKSVVQCGPCLPGLTRDRSEDVSECAPPDESAQPPVPAYIWTIIGFVVLAVILASAMLVYVFRKRELFRISTRTWLGSGCGAGAGGPLVGSASAPDPPPPYNPYTPYAPVRTDSPAPTDAPHDPASRSEHELSRPFVKRAPGGAGETGREVDASQSAVGYHPPAYVRLPPQSPFSPLNEDSESTNWPEIHNEDTTPHEWTPNDTSDNGNSMSEESGGAGGAGLEAGPGAGPGAAPPSDLPALLAAARETELVGPPAKKLRSEENNNNAGANQGGGDASGHAPNAPSFYVNIVQINNTKL